MQQREFCRAEHKLRGSDSTGLRLMETDMAANSTFVSFDGGIQQLEGEDTRVIVPAIIGTISGIGVGGNFLVLVVLIYVFASQSASEAYVMLANVCASEVLMLSLCAPARAITYYKQTWTLGLLACRTNEWIQHSCLAAKAFTLFALSQVHHSFPSHPENFRQKNVVITLMIIWMVSLLLPVPDLYFSSLKEEGNISLCISELHVYSRDGMRIFSKLLPLVIYALPVVLAAASHIRNIFLIRPSSHNEAFLSRQYENSLLYLSMIAMNTLLLLPEWASWLWIRHSLDQSCKPSAALLIFAQVCVYLSSAFIPAILLTMHVPLRESLSDLCSVLTCRDSKHMLKMEGNGNEMHTKEQDEHECDAKADGLSDASCQTLPDLEHFWSERRNTTVADETDPLPWERLNQSSVEFQPLTTVVPVLETPVKD
ncbi:hypothetical protein DNTS_015182 [Danionella cerebrum]|uniref:G-protein coupled receptors family 1 profile domain-containing protein n=1 Tax=Danionella cerebrum TaxID=2873325 RepID=A0A553MZJ0_9TELE|nr:hypothetical protein DNTS_015182 [Danionella translucida]